MIIMQPANTACSKRTPGIIAGGVGFVLEERLSRGWINLIARDHNVRLRKAEQLVFDPRGGNGADSGTENKGKLVLRSFLLWTDTNVFLPQPDPAAAHRAAWSQSV